MRAIDVVVKEVTETHFRGADAPALLLLGTLGVALMWCCSRHSPLSEAKRRELTVAAPIIIIGLGVVCMMPILAHTHPEPAAVGLWAILSIAMGMGFSIARFRQSPVGRRTVAGVLVLFYLGLFLLMTIGRLAGWTRLPN